MIIEIKGQVLLSIFHSQLVKTVGHTCKLTMGYYYIQSVPLTSCVRHSVDILFYHMPTYTILEDKSSWLKRICQSCKPNVIAIS